MVCLSTRVGLLWISLRFKALDVGVGLWEGKNRCFFLSRYCTALSLIFLLLLFFYPHQHMATHGHSTWASSDTEGSVCSQSCRSARYRCYTSSKYLHGGVAVGESVNMRGTGFEVCHLCQKMEASIDWWGKTSERAWTEMYQTRIG